MTKRMLLLGFAAFAACCFLATGLLAHHAVEDYYDLTKPITLKGVVRDFIRANPHAFILLDVKNAKGESLSWAVEGDAPNTLVAGGWTSTTVKRGDTITVTAYPAKPGMNLAGTLVIPSAPRGLRRIEEAIEGNLAGRLGIPAASPELVTLMKKVAERQTRQLLVHGAEVTLADGRKLIFGHARRYW